ncbi:MAG TPA: error-prone DNA polymerase, partial [Cryptosporangiaceae bacterium]|nr:error-prone DNA polymerase [Cryptosporangiaceae bacterium]
MGWGNPPVPWSTLERALSGRPGPSPEEIGDGGDSPAWSRRRGPYVPPPEVEPPPSAVPYVELHCHSNYSFLDGASHPEELVVEATRLGLSALALTDHDGMYGVARFAEAAREHDLKTIFGAELSLGLTRPQNGEADPEGGHLLVLARDPEGYHQLCAAISEAQLAGKQKGRPRYVLSDVAARADGHWLVLTGCRKGAVRRALGDADATGYTAAESALAELIALFGAENVAVELLDHGGPLDSVRNDALAALAGAAGLPTVATNNVHYHAPARRRLATALAAVRARRSLDEMEGWLPAAATAHLRSGEEMEHLFRRYPGAVARATALGLECVFSLELIAPNMPDCAVPDDHTEMSWLRELTAQGAASRYGPPGKNSKEAYDQLAHELEVIEQLGYPGYFLVVREITEWCRDQDILCQGRGSAANSAVCYALGITNVDAVRYKLLFERFLSQERDGPPDIDLDIESGRREEVIQHVYAKYGRDRAAQVANVITYRPRSAVRDMAKALGYDTGQQDAWSKQIEYWGRIADSDHDIPRPVVELAEELLRFPRHLGIHSGGMVLCDRPITEVCPVEWGRMKDRTVLQWDKDDCAAGGLVKFDLLGLGMLTALHTALGLLRDHHGLVVDLHELPLDDSAVYAMLQQADSVGVFQVESRAQMATLPRLRPKEFYDLVVEVALIRPGPIQGGSVHPYIRRHNGEEYVLPHRLLENALGKTHGVPLFQEQLMQMAVDVAGFSAAESDQLRRAIGAKRSEEKMTQLRKRLFDGMAERGITGELAETIYHQLAAFANFGFPESHAVSFAALVCYSSWLKRYFPAAFCAALLASQPMGFYSPQSLVADARRHGVTVRGPCLNASAADATLEPVDPGRPRQNAPFPTDGAEPRLDHAVRLGLSAVRHLGDDLAGAVVAERGAHGPYVDMTDLAERMRLSTAQLEALATAGAFEGFGLTRREALWAAGAVAQARPDRLAGMVVGTAAPPLPAMSEVEHAMADVWATGVSPTSHPTEFARAHLDALGAVPIAALAGRPAKTRVLVGGVVTHRQRPATAGGVTFLNLEDETGMLNVVCTPGAWARYRRVVRTAAALLVRGTLENAEGVVGVVAERVE